MTDTFCRDSEVQRFPPAPIWKRKKDWGSEELRAQVNINHHRITSIWVSQGLSIDVHQVKDNNMSIA